MVGLKPVAVTDAEVIFDAWGRYPENFSYLTVAAFSDVGDAQRYLTSLFPTPESKAFHIVVPSGDVVGIVKVAVLGHRAQVGYVVHRPFWGLGFATAALRQALPTIEALPQVARVWATCALGNPASVRVLEKCGFHREGILKNWVIYPAQGDRACDNYSYVRIPTRSA